MDSTVFDLLLSPALLLELLNNLSRSRAQELLRQILLLLQTEKSKMVTSPEVLEVPPESHTQSPSEVEPTEEIPSSRKLHVLQLLSLQLATFLDWDFAELNVHLPLALQQHLFEGLLSACGSSKFPLQLVSDSVESVVDKMENAAFFGSVLYCEWLVYSRCCLTLPLPVGQKMQIYSSVSNSSLPAVGNNEQIVATQTLAPAAQQVLIHLAENGHEFQWKTPLPTAFCLSDHGVVCEENGSHWQEHHHLQWRGQLLFAMARLHLALEEYTEAEEALKKSEGKALRTGRIQESQRRGMEKIFRSDHPKMSVWTLPSPQVVSKAMKNKANPFYSQINLALAIRFSDPGSAEKLHQQTLARRLEESIPPNFDWMSDSSENKNKSRKANFLDCLNQMSGPSSWSTKTGIGLKLTEPKTKVHPKIRRRIAMGQILSCSEPDKVEQTMAELHNLGANNLRRLVSRWTIREPANSSYLSSLGRDSDLDYVLVAKLEQMYRLLNVAESRQLLNSIISRAESRTRASYIQHLLIEQLSQELLASFKSGENKCSEEREKCIRAMKELDNMGLEVNKDAAENLLISLIMNGDWEVLFALKEPRWKLLRLSQLILSLVICYFKGGNVTVDVKKNSTLLVEFVQQCFFNPSTSSVSKRYRDGSTKAVNLSRRHLLQFLSKLHQVEYLQVLSSVIVFLYNNSIDDAGQRLDHDLPPLNLMPHLQMVPGHCQEYLSVLEQIVSQGDPLLPLWPRLAGEMKFAQNCYASALKLYMQSLLLQSQCFKMGVESSAEWEDKIIRKMTKCFIELDYHCYAVATSQFLYDPDYTVCFKHLEERRSNDGMDLLYGNVWDVTVLEYAVSMHNKRGEQARRRKALEKIGSLEINTNNNIEILRETSNFKRSNFMRVLCLNFL